MYTNLLSGRWIPKAGWSVYSTDISVKAEECYSSFVHFYISSFRTFDWILDFDILSSLISLILSFNGFSVSSVIISTLILHPDITSPTLWGYLVELYFCCLLPLPIQSHFGVISQTDSAIIPMFQIVRSTYLFWTCLLLFEVKSHFVFLKCLCRYLTIICCSEWD